jgi:hypothetical protein
MLKSVVRWAGLVLVLMLAWGSTPVRAQDSTQNSDTGKELGLYFWLAGLDGSMGFGRVSDVPVNASFSDIAGYVDFSMAGYFEYRQPRWIAGADMFWVKLGATRPGQINGANADVDLNMDQYIGALGGAYRLTPQLDLWLTGRLYSLKTSQTLQGSDLSADSHTWADIYVGARYHYNFGQRWIAIARADIGTGGSDFAWFGNLLAGYRFNDTFTLGASYRVLSLDRKTGSGGDSFKYDIVQDGSESPNFR